MRRFSRRFGLWKVFLARMRKNLPRISSDLLFAYLSRLRLPGRLENGKWWSNAKETLSSYFPIFRKKKRFCKKRKTTKFLPRGLWNGSPVVCVTNFMQRGWEGEVQWIDEGYWQLFMYQSHWRIVWNVQFLIRLQKESNCLNILSNFSKMIFFFFLARRNKSVELGLQFGR